MSAGAMTASIVPRLRARLRRLGVAGILALGVFFLCVPLYFSGLQPAERELAAARHVSGDRPGPRAPLRQVAFDERAEELARFYALFPPVERLGGELERVYGLARASGLELLQGEYRMEKTRAAGLIPYRVVLPVRGTYSQLRAFIGAVLTDMPVASIDALRFERKKSADAQLEAQVRITVHFQPAKDHSGDRP